jgi:hypothetical protein
MRSNAGREAEYRRSHWNHSFSAFPLTRLGVCYCLGSGPVSHQGALRAREAENLPQMPRDAANSESLCRRAYERESLYGLGFQITPVCPYKAEVGGSSPSTPTGWKPLVSLRNAVIPRVCFVHGPLRVHMPTHAATCLLVV